MIGGGPPGHPALAAAAAAARVALVEARSRWSPEVLAEEVALGADGTPSTRLDLQVEAAVLAALEPHGVNVISEEAGFIDAGSEVTAVIDPLDGTANALAGVPICAFSGAIAVAGRLTDGLVDWLDAGWRWAASLSEPAPWRTSGRRRLEGAAVAMLRPRAETREAWSRVAERAGRIRVLGCSAVEAALVAQGAIDAFADPGGDTHRLVDLAAAVVLLEAAGGAVVDACGRPIEVDRDLTRRWSGIAAASPELAAELARTISGR